MNSTNNWVVAGKLALRELRSGLQGFRIFLMCLVLGVGAIAIVGALSAAFDRGVTDQGQPLLGGDMEFSLNHRQIGDAERAHIATLGEVSTVATLRAMAAAGEPRSLVEIKAIDDGYPLYGELELTRGGNFRELLDERDGRWGAVAEKVLLDRLALNTGDVVAVGEAEIEIRGVIAKEPDRVSDGFILGPRLLIRHAALDATGLIKPGSLVRWRYRVKMPQSASRDDVKTLRKQARDKFPDAGWRIRTRERAAPGVDRFVDRLTFFLTLVGLTSLVVGGVGIANAVKTFIERRQQNIATLKCLGATSGLVLAAYAIQIFLIASLGIAIGVLLGLITPFVASWGFSEVLPVPLSARIEWQPLLQAIAFGYLVVVTFAAWPLGRMRAIAPSALFRDQVETHFSLPPFAFMLVSLIALQLICVMAFAVLSEPRFTVWYIAGVIASFGILSGLAWLVMKLARDRVRAGSAVLNHAIANLHRPGAPTPSIVLSLGLGLTLFVTLALVDSNISAQLRSSIPERAPSFFFLDVPNTERDAFTDLVRAQPTVGEIKTAPMLRGRVVSVAGVPARKVKATPDTRWALHGDRGLTYSDTLPAGSELTAGEWWPPDYDGPPLVSFTQDIATGIGLKLGDEVTVNVLGRDVTATVASFRRVDWRSLNINFVMVFSPNTLAGAPHMNIVTVNMAEDRAGELLKTVSAAYPTVTAVRVKDVLDAVNDLLGNLVVAIRSATALTFVVGTLVLAGALASSLSRREYDSVVLKTFGATRAQLMGSYAFEFAMLGLVAAVFSVSIGGLAAWGIVRFVLEMPFTFGLVTAIATAVSAMLLTIIAGFAATWQALAARPARVLRTE